MKATTLTKFKGIVIFRQYGEVKRLEYSGGITEAIKYLYATTSITTNNLIMTYQEEMDGYSPKGYASITTI